MLDFLNSHFKVHMAFVGNLRVILPVVDTIYVTTIAETWRFLNF